MIGLIHWTAGLLHSLGLGAVVAVLLVESLGIPSPSEIVLLLAGLLVAEGRFSYAGVVLAGAAGSTAGAVLAYWLARTRGRAWLLRRLRFLFRSPEALARWEAYFLRHGPLIVMVGRVLSGVRMVISYPAGLFGMPWPRFVLFTGVGSLAWPALATGAGWFLGPRVLAALRTLHRAEEAVVIALAAAVLAFWLGRRARRARRPAVGRSGD
ncbi:MAG: VTT domain-containing protein [Actinomycetia bacterium]|nr:VTT domain-containing protein [Actinomycetes bacterium]